MRVLITTLAITVLSFLPFTIYALDIKSGYVFTEDPDEDFKTCSIDNVSIKASIEAALRANGVKPGSMSSTNLRFYSRVTALETSKQFCAVSYKLKVYVYQPVIVEISDLPKKTVWTTVELCEKSGLISFNKLNIQQRLNTDLKAMVDMCISEISRME